MFGNAGCMMAIWRECLALLEIVRQCFDAICRECLAMLGVRLYDGNLEGMFGPIGGLEAIF